MFFEFTRSNYFLQNNAYKVKAKFREKHVLEFLKNENEILYLERLLKLNFTKIEKSIMYICIFAINELQHEILALDYFIGSFLNLGKFFYINETRVGCV